MDTCTTDVSLGECGEKKIRTPIYTFRENRCTNVISSVVHVSIISSLYRDDIMDTCTTDVSLGDCGEKKNEHSYIHFQREYIYTNGIPSGEHMCP